MSHNNIVKKYYTIKEVSKLLGASERNVRALDKTLKNNLLRIRGRRYYKDQNIETLRSHIKTDPAMQRINALIASFSALKKQLECY